MEDLANNSEVLHTERRAGKGESLFCQNAIYCRQLIYVATEHRQRERKEGKQRVTRGMSTTRKGLHGEAECTFAMHSKGEGSEQGRCSDEQEVSIWGRAASGAVSEMMGRMEDRLN